VNTHADPRAGRFSRGERGAFKANAAVLAVFACAMCIIIPKGIGWAVAAALAVLMMLAPPLTICAVRRLKGKGRPDA
jgi:hypothetical protein